MTMFIVLLLLACFQGLSAVQWTSAYRNATRICPGANLTLGSDYSLEPGETVNSITWSFVSHSGQPQLVIAAYGFGFLNFNPSYANRLTHPTNGTVVLASVTSQDAGTYTTRIFAKNASLSFVTFVRHLVVTVEGASAYRNMQLSMKMEYKAVADLRGQFRVRFKCGPLAWRGDAAVDVIWTTPSGAQFNSTVYENDYFYLTLDGAVEDGDYACGLPASAIPALCLQAGDNLAKQAVVQVSSTTARLALLEANLQQATQRLEQAERDNANQTQELQQVKAEQEQLRDLASIHVGFHARVETPDLKLESSTIVKFARAYYNDGGAYNENTGTFTAPVNGTYFFAVTTFSYEEGSTSTCLLVVDHRFMAYIPSTFNGHFNPATGHAVVHLVKGSQVYVTSSVDRNQFFAWSIFSGFLVRPDW